MSIPPFDADGHLPAGVHHATVDEVRTDLVDAFPHPQPAQPFTTGGGSIAMRCGRSWL